MSWLRNAAVKRLDKAVKIFVEACMHIEHDTCSATADPTSDMGLKMAWRTLQMFGAARLVRSRRCRPVPAYANRLRQPCQTSVGCAVTASIHPLLMSADTSTPEIKRLCARWLTWRRTRLGLTCRMTALYLRIPQKTLLLLEFGDADSRSIHLPTCSHLSYMLAGTDDSPARIASIIAAALGNVDDLHEPVLQQIIADLQIELPACSGSAQ